MCVVNKQFELLEFVSESVYVDLQYDEIYLTFTAGPVCLCGVSSPVVVLGQFGRLLYINNKHTQYVAERVSGRNNILKALADTS